MISKIMSQTRTRSFSLLYPVGLFFLLMINDKAHTEVVMFTFEVFQS